MAFQPRSHLNLEALINHWVFRYGLSLVLFGLTIGLSLLLTRYGIRINLTIPVVLALVAAA